jgi:hypothetical protein
LLGPFTRLSAPRRSQPVQAIPLAVAWDAQGRSLTRRSACPIEARHRLNSAFASGTEAPSAPAQPLGSFRLFRASPSLSGPKSFERQRDPSEVSSPSEPCLPSGDRSPFRSGAALPKPCLSRTERAVEMTPRASSPSGV